MTTSLTFFARELKKKKEKDYTVYALKSLKFISHFSLVGMVSYSYIYIYIFIYIYLFPLHIYSPSRNQPRTLTIKFKKEK